MKLGRASRHLCLRNGHSKGVLQLSEHGTYTFALILTVTLSIASVAAPSSALQAAQPFTVADDIGLTLFGNPSQTVQFSPDENYFAVYTERGRLDVNRLEDSLRFYRSHDVKLFLSRSDTSQLPPPIWVVTRSTAREGPVIDNWRWLADSSGVAFLERMSRGNQRLMLADLQHKTIEPLTSATETIRTFDVRDRHHYAYVEGDLASSRINSDRYQASATVGTGRSLFELLFPDNPRSASSLHHTYLHAVLDSRRFEIKQNGEPLVSEGDIALSPDSRSIVTRLPVKDIPSIWETLYPPSYSSSPFHIRASGIANQYVQINLETGSVQALTDAPIGADAGLWSGGVPSWSGDGQAVLLPGTFVKSNNNVPSRPCVAVVDLLSGTRTCVEMLKGETEIGVEDGYHLIGETSFIGGDKQRVRVVFMDHRDQSYHATEYRHGSDGTWQIVKQGRGGTEVGPGGLEVSVKEGLNDPPVLVATNKQTLRVIFNPNPQLQNFELGQASVYTWKDKEGRGWTGGLYKPANYKLGKRYPLVIQTHGFSEFEFRPSGIFPAAFAARALAATGIVVLQIGSSCPLDAPDEGPCNAGGYESGANQLVAEGLVDSEKIGIIGFSRTCFHVMETLTTGTLHLKAASITDGVMENYLQYMMAVDFRRNLHAREANAIIGAPPFGEGLQQWLKRSPDFNLDKVTAPLLVAVGGRFSLLFMWEPYAGLRYLQKPVDLIMLNTDEHILTNPAVRMASQGGSVDWFRFWLQGYEDPDPAKVEQYTRWRELRKLQEANEHTSTASQAKSH